MSETTLSKAPMKKLKVVGISGGLNLRRRLEFMGINIGSVIEKQFSYGNGPVVVKVMNSTLAIGRGMAEKIIVEEEG